MIYSEPLAALRPAAHPSLAVRSWRHLLEVRLGALREGVIEVADGDWVRRFGTSGDPALVARIEIRDRRTYRSLAFGGAIGAAEAYANGWWTATDLTALMRIPR